MGAKTTTLNVTIYIHTNIYKQNAYTFYIHTYENCAVTVVVKSCKKQMEGGRVRLLHDYNFKL